MKKYIILLVMLILLMSFEDMSAERQFKIFDSSTGQQISIDELVQLTGRNDVIFFGEFHDDSLIHLLQNQYLVEMYKEFHSDLVVSMEMFERDVQGVLSKYLKGELTEEEFLKDSRPWPNYQTDYKPLVDLAKNNSSYVIAANVPRKYAAMFSKGGKTSLRTLLEDEKKLIAREINIMLDDYQKDFYNTMLSSFGKDSIEQLSANEENTVHLFYGAQVMKDETMGESITDYLALNNQKKVIHFNGSFHSSKGLGTPQKVNARNPKLNLTVITPIYVTSGEEILFKDEYKNEGDYIIALEEKPPEMFENMMSGHMGGNYIVKHEIDITLNTKDHSIKGSDKLMFSAPIIKSASFNVTKDLKIINVSSVESDLQWKIIDKGDIQEIVISPVNSELTNLEVTYQGTVYNQANERNLKQKHAYSEGMISAEKGEGVYLPAGSYYPYTNDDLAEFSLKMTYPNDITIITSGVLQSTQTDGNLRTDVYKTELVADNLTLVGGRYSRIDTVYDGKTFSVLLLEPNRSGQSYLNAMIDYYNYYTKLFGKYPYSNFTLVDNFFATGFGMPGYTLLSGKLLQMPWVVLSPGSLAHEFVHNWWGNSVYIKPNSGNWCEALTTYSSNYYYNVLTGNQAGALDWRKKALISIENLPSESNYPLEEFKYQETMDDAVIGYSKGGFLFYELNQAMGDEHFWNAIKGFAEKYTGKRATWFSMIMSFSGYAKKNKVDVPIMKIFNQWLKTKDVPSLFIEKVDYSGNTLTVNLNQDISIYTTAPIKITTDSAVIWKNINIDGVKANNSFEINGNVKQVELDPDYQVLRRLNYWEMPYTFNSAMNDNPIIILPSKKSEQYKIAEEFVKLFIESGYKADSKSCDDIKNEDWANRSFMVIGDEKSNSFFAQLNGKYPLGVNFKDNILTGEGKEYKNDDNILLFNFGHPKYKEKYATVIGYSEIESVEQFRRLFHYTSYSLVMINKTKMGKPVYSKEIFPIAPEQNYMKWVNQ